VIRLGCSGSDRARVCRGRLRLAVGIEELGQGRACREGGSPVDGVALVLGVVSRGRHSVLGLLSPRTGPGLGARGLLLSMAVVGKRTAGQQYWTRWDLYRIVSGALLVLWRIQTVDCRAGWGLFCWVSDGFGDWERRLYVSVCATKTSHPCFLHAVTIYRHHTTSVGGERASTPEVTATVGRHGGADAVRVTACPNRRPTAATPTKSPIRRQRSPSLPSQCASAEPNTLDPTAERTSSDTHNAHAMHRQRK